MPCLVEGNCIKIIGEVTKSVGKSCSRIRGGRLGQGICAGVGV